MATLLKFYKPFVPIRFPRIPKKKSLIRNCLSSLSSSQPSIPSFPPLWLYNTMRKEKQEFKPKVEGKVSMYVCGVTAYDLSHIGHARVYVTFDVLYRSFILHIFAYWWLYHMCYKYKSFLFLGRYLRHLGNQVCYVRNFTDVDDKVSYYCYLLISTVFTNLSIFFLLVQ